MTDNINENTTPEPDEDVEGHRLRPGHLIEDDDVEGHAVRQAPADDVTDEGIDFERPR
jgi:hypothetical protein